MKTTRKSTPCPGCGGSGQTSYFAGESRFMFTWEDCPDCAGTGVILDGKARPEPLDDTGAGPLSETKAGASNRNRHTP